MSPKPITIYSLGPAPNPWKVIMLFEELGIPYDDKPVNPTELKKEPFESVNPNGRTPAITDPNTGITLWESGAILEYLVETYDKEHKISFPHGSKESFLAKQWLHFQVSGQGPYFGQAIWFARYHPEKIQSAQERYVKEMRRVSGVLDRFLTDKQYLVGGIFSYADLAFIPWFGAVEMFGISIPTEFPHLDAWLKRVQARPAIAKAIKAREKAFAESS